MLGTTLAMSVTFAHEGEEIVERPSVDDAVPRHPAAAGCTHSPLDIVILGDVVAVGGDDEAELVEVAPLGAFVAERVLPELGGLVR